PRHVATRGAGERAVQRHALRRGGPLATRCQSVAEAVPGRCARVARVDAVVRVVSMELRAMSAAGSSIAAVIPAKAGIRRRWHKRHWGTRASACAFAADDSLLPSGGGTALRGSP